MVEHEESFECVICMNIMIIPVKLKCGHTFCLDCIEQVSFQTFNSNEDNYQMSKCPMDRKEFNPKIPHDLIFDDKKFKRLLLFKSKEFQDSVKAYSNSLNNKSFKKNLILSYGNEHSLIESFESENKHRWKAFVRLGKIDEQLENIFSNIRKQADLDDLLNINEKKTYLDGDIENYIDFVTFELHPTFNPNKIMKKESPFTLTRVGWGTFDIKAIVKFKEELGLKNEELKISLSFDSPITLNNKFIELN